MKKILLVFVSICFMHAVHAQSEEEQPKFKNEIGIHGGFTTGVGLSYRNWFADRFGVQLTFIPVKYEDLTWVSGGVTLMRSFYESKYVRVFGYLGNHVYYHEYESYVESYSDPNTGNYVVVNEDVAETKYNVGFGPGFSFGKTVQFNVMAGYGLYDVTGSFYMLPTGEIGLYYRF